jgi:NADH-quinone oxidoreductase subunit J
MTNLMEIAFFVAGSVAVIATILAITRLVVVHALLYLIVSLLAVAVVFYTMGAPLVAALEVIIYAGAIVVLFVFVVMMLNLGAQAREIERKWLAGRAWIGPVILSALLLAEVIYLIIRAPASATISSISTPKQIGLALYGPYLLGVELASMLLLGALVGACHLGRTSKSGREARQ